MWTFRVAVAIGGRGVDANLRILQILKGAWRTVGRVALPNCARKRRSVVQFPWELAEGSGLRLKILASRSIDAWFISQDINGQSHCRLLPFSTEPVTSEAHPYPHRLRPVRGRRTRIKYVIGLTGLAEVFRHSWYQSKKFLEWLIEEIRVVEEMIRRKVPSV
ncbi:hypothetical protein Taro_014260 [Colocasia esculenta]|uniref:Uncharacterized protein n=1 Tax=Colocasia esculenta TaxID=4460 RepID=A0A843UE10_COLES|nr:hypothetical protein [Colocasia esculenta]